ncbi:MAG: ATP-dependent Clp protease adaptor ClpS [Cytophagaceae bacterium]|nr:ATP-dependent Clp protease adaptor ClpS [Cytophagaceae bacterium]MDW8457150.1 ATP-dependent Clp protease adaptor ClpS [Cytophagaceae bacterium]
MKTIQSHLPFKEEEVTLLEDTHTSDTYDLVVFNDDYNTFDHVINTLIKVCGHTPEQAEQCTWIIHFKGKCSVKKGYFEELAPMRQGICDRGISAEIL